MPSAANEALTLGNLRSATAAALTIRSFTESFSVSGSTALICARSAMAAAMSISMVT